MGCPEETKKWSYPLSMTNGQDPAHPGFRKSSLDSGLMRRYSNELKVVDYELESSPPQRNKTCEHRYYHEKKHHLATEQESCGREVLSSPKAPVLPLPVDSG